MLIAQSLHGSSIVQEREGRTEAGVIFLGVDDNGRCSGITVNDELLNTLDDLDLDYFRTQFLPRAIPPDAVDQNSRPLTQQLESLRLTLRGIPTNGAMIVLGRDPQRWVPGAYVQFLRIDGREITDPIRDQKPLTGRLEDVLRRLDELLEINMSVRTDITSEARELRRPDYPIIALQQLVRNAVMHPGSKRQSSPNV